MVEVVWRFVWIYIHGPSDYAKTGRFYELEHSIKSVRKFYKGKYRIIVVGDDPELDGVIHIPVDRIETCKRGYYRHFDQIKKLMAAMEVVKRDFVLMYDDIYLLQPVNRKILQKIYARKRIISAEEHIKERHGDGSYKSCWLSTYNRISEFREDLWEWETHLPRFMTKSKFLDIVERFKLEKVAYLSYSLYAAVYGGEPELIDDSIQSEVLEAQPMRTDWKKILSARFLNSCDEGLDQGFITNIKAYLD